jgi:hypothetical protein
VARRRQWRVGDQPSADSAVELVPRVNAGPARISGDDAVLGAVGVRIPGIGAERTQANDETEEAAAK